MPVTPRHRRAGFTLVEIIIVIAIVGVLMSIVLAATNTVQEKGRDTRRVSDIKEIQIGLALYFDVYKAYPATLSTLAASGQSFLPSVPTDPSTGASYPYLTYNSAKDYCLGATLETTAIPSDDVSNTNSNCSSLSANYRVSR